MKSKKTVAIITARGGSKRLPNKNIMPFGDFPLLVHSINYAKENSDIIDDVYVTTDSDAIKQIATDYGAKVIHRPKAISGDSEPTITALQHALSTLHDIETVVLLQPTNPLRPMELLKEAYEIIEEKNLDSLFTVSQNYKKLGKITADKFHPFNYKIGERSQDLESLYYENGLLYIVKASLIKKGIIFNELSYPLIVNHRFAEIDIDRQSDFEYACYILKNLNAK